MCFFSLIFFNCLLKLETVESYKRCVKLKKFSWEKYKTVVEKKPQIHQQFGPSNKFNDNVLYSKYILLYYYYNIYYIKKYII